MQIKINNLTKKIHGTTVLNNISLEFNSNKIYGLSGKNGSGKTMLMRAISGLIRPTDGEIIIGDGILGKDFSFPPSIGVLIENPSFIPKYTGFKNLKLLASIQNKTSDSEIKQTLNDVGLDPEDKRPYRKYSLGMKQRLGIAMALLGEPKLLILDEPTNGLDPIGIEELRELIRSFPAQGITVILSSHILSEVQLLADHVGIISDGILGYEGPVEQGENLEELFMNVVRENRKAGESCV